MLATLRDAATAAAEAPFDTMLELTKAGVEINVTHAGRAYRHIVGWRELDASHAREVMLAIKRLNHAIQFEIDNAIAQSTGVMQQRRPPRRLP